jgi:hypothetical protein
MQSPPSLQSDVFSRAVGVVELADSGSHDAEDEGLGLSLSSILDPAESDIIR